VRTLAADLPGVPDGELLSRYLAGRDADAFAALVRRHGPMVLGVCRRILRHHQDAEDAFQATFLVLLRKAATVRPRGMVGHWLYGVAYQTALRARCSAAKRRGRETHPADVPEPATTEKDGWGDLLPLLDRELNALPAKYRAVVVLCDLEGKTRKEAAGELGWPEGTVAGRLARGRALLASRLVRRGALPSLASLGVALANGRALACVPVPLTEATVRAAGLFTESPAAGAISGHVAALTEGVLQAMLLNKIMKVAVLLLVACLGLGAGGLLYQTRAADSQPSGPPPVTGTTLPLLSEPVRPGDSSTATPASRLDPPPSIPDIRPPLSEQEVLRTQYVKLHEELSHHLSAQQLKQQIANVEKTLATLKEQKQKRLREQQSAADLEKARILLGEIVSRYPDTEAGSRARKALESTTAVPDSGPRPAGSNESLPRPGPTGIPPK
jgi:RNA polymerase sigma factor (sigma-70 family)